MLTKLINQQPVKNVKVIAKHYWWGYTNYKLQLTAVRLTLKNLKKTDLILLNQRSFQGQKKLVISNLVPGSYEITLFKANKQVQPVKMLNLSSNQQLVFNSTAKKEAPKPVAIKKKQHTPFTLKAMQKLFIKGFKTAESGASGATFVNGKQSRAYKELHTIFTTYQNMHSLRQYQYQLKVKQLKHLTKQTGLVTYQVQYSFVPAVKFARVHQQTYQYTGEVK